jgi:flavodoxin
MTYSIVYSSQTGNTALLAQQIKAAVPEKDLIFFGDPETAAPADLIFVGFWTDRGSCDARTAAFLHTLRGQKVFLFGTAGFGGSETYFSQILARVSAELDSSDTVAGSYMCQGKMPLSVRRRYEAMQAAQPEKMQALIENFDRALTHPDQADLAGLEQAIAQWIGKQS